MSYEKLILELKQAHEKIQRLEEEQSRLKHHNESVETAAKNEIGGQSFTGLSLRDVQGLSR